MESHQNSADGRRRFEPIVYACTFVTIVVALILLAAGQIGPFFVVLAMLAAAWGGTLIIYRLTRGRWCMKRTETAGFLCDPPQL